MKKFIAILTAVFALLAPNFALADETYSCIDVNKDLHFVLYENNLGMRGGHLYMKNIQVAVLEAERINDISIHAKVKGNTADTKFIFNSSRETIYISLGDTVEELCKARVRKFN